MTSNIISHLKFTHTHIVFAKSLSMLGSINLVCIPIGVATVRRPGSKVPFTNNSQVDIHG